MTETKLQVVKSRSPWSEGWMGVAMGITLIGSALLTMGGTSSKAPATRETSSASAAASADSGRALTADADADRDTLDLQLD
ncbi:MAG: hypothetical protein ABI682_01745 [Acidobacteriota bacterium]